MHILNGCASSSMTADNMNDENLQEVYYDRYCKTCEHKKLPEEADPCDECLSNPVNYATHKPMNWEGK